MTIKENGRKQEDAGEQTLIHLLNEKGQSVWYDGGNRALTCGKKRVHLTPIEQKLLEVLATHPGELLSTVALYYAVHPDDVLPETRYDVLAIREVMRPTMSRLRTQLRAVGISSCLETVRGDGFIFNSPNSHR